MLNLVTRLKNSIDQFEKWSIRARTVCDESKKQGELSLLARTTDCLSLDPSAYQLGGSLCSQS